jgi:hypothetical protein
MTLLGDGTLEKLVSKILSALMFAYQGLKLFNHAISTPKMIISVNG